MTIVSLLLLLTVLLPILEAASKLPSFKVHGSLTCRGEPIKGNILMVDDNFAFTDHLLNERRVADDGKFNLFGEPDDDCLDILLIVEHKCHNWKFGRHDRQKLRVYSEFRVNLQDLNESNLDLEMNIELLNSQVKMSSPMIPAWKCFLYGKRMFSDNLSRIKNLPIWKFF